MSQAERASERVRGDAGRGADEELALPLPPDLTNLEDRGARLQLYKQDGGSSSRNRRRSMQNDAKRTMVGVGIDLVNVSDLDDGEQRKERQANNEEDREGPWPRATITAHPCVKCVQTQVPVRGPTSRIHTIGCAGLQDVTGENALK